MKPPSRSPHSPRPSVPAGFAARRLAVDGLDPLSAVLPEAAFFADPVQPGDGVALGWQAEDMHGIA